MKVGDKFKVSKKISLNNDTIYTIKYIDHINDTVIVTWEDFGVCGGIKTSVIIKDTSYNLRLVEMFFNDKSWINCIKQTRKEKLLKICGHNE